MNKVLYIVVSLTVVIVALGGYVVWFLFQITTNNEGEKVKQVFAPEVREVLDLRIVKIENLSADQTLYNEVKRLNKERKEWNVNAIEAFDRRLQGSSDADPFFSNAVQGPATEVLRNFRSSHPEFLEIFVTDVYGINVAQTNRTSDYYQADEVWWQEAFRGGRGVAYYGEIEFDESAASDAISLYVPVRDPRTGEAIGIIKAVLSMGGIIELL